MAKEYTSIRVSKASKKQAEAAKRDDETWDDYVQRCSNNPPEVREVVETEADLDGVVEMLSTVEERTGRLERLLEDLQR